MARAERGQATRRAYDKIRHDIIAGVLAPGTMLSEADLASALGLSRTPVRTALGRLQEDGWIRIYPQRGALVRELTPTEIREAAEVRHALETAGVLRAMPDRLDDLRQPTLNNLSSQERALAEGDFARFNELSQQFHRAFVELADNATMLALYDRVQDRQLLSTATRARHITQNPHTILTEHHTLQQQAWNSDWIRFADTLQTHQSSHHQAHSHPLSASQGGVPRRPETSPA